MTIVIPAVLPVSSGKAGIQLSKVENYRSGVDNNTNNRINFMHFMILAVPSESLVEDSDGDKNLRVRRRETLREPDRTFI